MRRLLYPVYVRVRRCLDIFRVGILFILLLPVILVVRLLKPVYHVRFGAIKGDRIGHMALDIELYLARRELGVEPVALDLVFFGGRPRYMHPLESIRPVNAQLGRMIKRVLHMHPLVRYLYFANRFVPGWRSWDCSIGGYNWGSLDLWGCLATTEPHLDCSHEEDERGRQYVTDIGLGADDRWVCLNVRDKAFFGENADDTHTYRNSRIESYYDAALWLAEQGYWVFRMGRTVAQGMAPVHPRIVDYASRPDRSDLMDVWLSAKCHFIVSTGSGIESISIAFRRPMVHVNFLPLGFVSGWYGNHVFIPKQLHWRESGEPLSLDEQISSGAIIFSDTNDFRESCIEVIDNSPDEILDAVMELDARLAGTWEDAPGDEARQRLFWDVFTQWPQYRQYHPETVHCHIGASFLRACPGLIEGAPSRPEG